MKQELGVVTPKARTSSVTPEVAYLPHVIPRTETACMKERTTERQLVTQQTTGYKDKEEIIEVRKAKTG
jgi:hypothetical protein